MKKEIVLMMFVGGLVISSCDNKKIEIAQRENDSLRTELLASQQLAEEMETIGALMDSIDVNRKVLKTDMLEGTSFESYADRMRSINEYVKLTEEKIDALEKTARESKANAGSYASTIKKLKENLARQSEELAALTEQVNLYKNENSNLVQTTTLQKAEIDDKLNQIKVKQEEVANLQGQVQQLQTQARLDEGESYYARAVAVEETANRTQLAPRKKKETMKEALELYKLAQLFGKSEADVKIQALEKRLNKRQKSDA